jgi:DNA polymerase-3 subunit epsilon
MRFLAIDFETANHSPDSACAVGLAIVENGRIVRKKSSLIRPPSDEFVFSYIHGIGWEDVKNQPSFGDLWPEISGFFEGIDFAVAHNAPFDKRILKSCCERYLVDFPPVEFRCTVQLSRNVLGFRPANLVAVCKRLKIRLKHHDALSDTLACARIMLKVLEAGMAPVRDETEGEECQK